MERIDVTARRHLEKDYPSTVRKYNVNGKDYIVKSVFTGDKDVKTMLFNLAAKKAAKEMGLDYIGT